MTCVDITPSGRHILTGSKDKHVAIYSASTLRVQREIFIDNLLVRIHFIIVMIRWTGLAPWEFEFPFPGSLTSTFLGSVYIHRVLDDRK